MPHVGPVSMRQLQAGTRLTLHMRGAPLLKAVLTPMFGFTVYRQL